MRSFALLLLLLLALPAGAVEPDEKLADPALEQRARDISQGVRCLVCQNQDIDSSNAELAKDLRVIIRERLVEGDSDQEIEDFLVARYGDFVLLKPPFKPSTYLLWIGPFLLLLLGGVGVAFYLRREAAGSAKESGPAPLSESEKEKLARILGGRDAG
jgi:cytochrome c-type biogenesis protein CcmH